MNVLIKRKVKGMTLIELMISIVLFVMIAGVAAYTISSGIRAHAFDRRVRNAQTAARDVITKLCNEMRCASLVPASGGGMVPSGVIYPDSYGDGDAMIKTKFSINSKFYYLGTKKVGGDSEKNLVYFSKNRVIFIRPKSAITSLDSNAIAGEIFNPNNPSDYVFVEWYVPYASQNKVYRRVFKYQQGGGGGFSGAPWLIIPSYFENTSNLIASAAASSGGSDKFMVGSLDGEYDSFDLCVYHARYIYPGTNSPGLDIPYNTNYERNLFTAVLNTRVMRGHAQRDSTGRYTASSRNDYSEASLTQQVRIQGGI